ncbi:MAG TPA: hypothetical protein DCX54_07820 [Flavobacteriales bacterium]|nr:hypothetical protein [Flavobacteriales bacterium]
MSNIVFSIVLDEPGVILTDSRSLVGGGLSWTALVVTTIIIFHKSGEEERFEEAVFESTKIKKNRTIQVLKKLIGPGLLSVGIGSFVASIVDLFVFFVYGLTGLDNVPDLLFWIASLFYVLACIGASLLVYILITKRKRTNNESLEKMFEVAQPTSTSSIKFWPPTAIGFLTFFFMFPSGVLLASINWLRMGLNKKAIYHLVAGLVGAFIFIIVLLLIPDNGARGFSYLINIGVAYYLSRQTKNDLEKFKENNGTTQDAHWFGGCLIGLMMYGFYLFLLFLVFIVFDIAGVPIV